MTANWASVLVYVLLLAFFVVIALGIAIGAYAASVLKKREHLLVAAAGASAAPSTLAPEVVED